jgi:hypothetical protein
MKDILDEPIKDVVKQKTITYLIKYWFLTIVSILITICSLSLMWECYRDDVVFNVWIYPTCMVILSLYTFYHAQVEEVQYREEERL